MDMVSVTERNHVLMAEGKTGLIGEAVKKCLLSMRICGTITIMERFTDFLRQAKVGECLDITEFCLRGHGRWTCYSWEWRTTEEWMNGC
ncbi:hypothetical protein L211DRAFT_875423 [Terfezia boudieri ATCC MYA-4762]|uniref:Uncharacterized protein n=1 Tax=Terfezia boudieri ATCC MYA-4762 TaxID=1051890 RepID=A0A3N4LRT7_9PEZI|nr:hypothetical protein L211DRAFT_875423 [Terfezia boudieri ATCC MYA-4762]